MTGVGAFAATRPARVAGGRLAALVRGAVVFFLALLACGFLPARGATLALASQEQPEGVPTDTQGHDPIEEQAGSDQGLADAIDALMDAREGAHAAVLVSRDGETLAQGYYDAVDGSASVSTDPDASFAWGHVSDMLVWVAVMQLVEQGSIELADPVSTLLSGAVELPQGYSSISMLNLMNHTTGLDVLPIVNSALPQTGSSSAQGLLEELRRPRRLRGGGAGLLLSLRRRPGRHGRGAGERAGRLRVHRRAHPRPSGHLVDGRRGGWTALADAPVAGRLRRPGRKRAALEPRRPAGVARRPRSTRRR